jgi:hypothetical protein
LHPNLNPSRISLPLQAKENNFKAVLESIRDLLNEDCVLPPWLHDILLGYGDPGAAQYQHMEGCLQTVDFKDTFLDTGGLGWVARGLPGAGCCVESGRPPTSSSWLTHVSSMLHLPHLRRPRAGGVPGLGD